MGEIPPRVATGEAPALYKVGANAFQQLTRDLLSFEPGALASVYGTSGDPQDGIDVLVRRTDATRHVAQCKCYPTIDPADLRAASAEFLKHLPRWKEQGVNRFVLATTADCTRRSIQTEIDDQVLRFRELRLSYEVWDVHELVSRMRPHREIVATYFASAADWISIICGPQPNAAELLAARLEYEVAATRRHAREGRWSEVNDWFEATAANDDLAASIPRGLFATVQLVGAQAALNADDLDLAEMRFRAAEPFAADEHKMKIRAMIAIHRRDIPSALKFLEGSRNRDNLNLAAEIAVYEGDLDYAASATADHAASVEANADTHRIRSLIAFLRGNVDQAAWEQAKAESISPEYESVQAWSAEFAYFSGLAIKFTEKSELALPQPVPPSLVRVDALAAAGFRRAADGFKQLSRLYRPGSTKWRLYTTWALASLCNDLSRPQDASEYAEEIFAIDWRNSWALEWAVQERVSYDLSDITTGLLREYRAGLLTVDDTLLLVSIQAMNSFEKAHELLCEMESSLRGPDQKVRWAIEVVRCSAELGKTIITVRLEEGLPEEHLTYLRGYIQLVERNNEQANAAFKAQAEEGNPSSLYFYADALVKQNDWKSLRSIEARLLQLGTSNALGFAVAAAYYANDFNHALRLIDEYGPRIHGGQTIPLSLRRIRAQVLHALGNLPDAVAELEVVCREDNRTDNLILLAEFLAHLGDTKGVGVVARDLSQRRDLAPLQGIAVCRFVQFDDPETASRFWLKYADLVPDDYVISALTLGYALGLQRHTAILAGRASALASQPDSGIEIVSLDQLAERMKGISEALSGLGDMYMHGTATVHAVSAQTNVSLVELYHAQLSDKEASRGRGSPLFIRHGSSGAAESFELPAATRLHLDIVSLLLAFHLGIFDAVEAAFPVLILSKFVPRAMQSMIEQAGAPHVGRVLAYEAVSECVAAGTISVIVNRDEGGPYAVGSLSAITASLCALGELTARRRAEAIGETDEADGHVEHFKRGQRVAIELNTLVALQESQLLIVAAAVFTLGIERSQMALLTVQMRDASRRAANQRWLRELRDKIADAVARRKVIYTDELIDPVVDESPADPTLQALSSMMIFRPAKDDVLWIDDRAINRFAHRDGMPIVSVVEVMQTLVSRGVLSRVRFYELILRLRESDARFIPLLSSEIVHWVRLATTDVYGELDETTALATLRTYAKRVVEEARFLETNREMLGMDAAAKLQSPAVAKDMRTQVTAAATQAVLELRQIDLPESERRARVRWIVEAFSL